MIDLRRFSPVGKTKHPFGICPASVATELRALADKIESRAVAVSEVNLYAEAAISDFTTETLVIQFAPSRAEDEA
jgi:hypothetical protein